MRVLLLGGGGREHAIGWKLSASSSLDALVSAPGNPGLETLGDTLPDLDINDGRAVGEAARRSRIDLVVIGPEAPLAGGVVDALQAAGVPAFGPNAAGARLEASKAYAKQVMDEAGVPTAASKVFQDRREAVAYISGVEGPWVVKADGLAAGKGVLVTDDMGAAQDWARTCLDGRFGEAGRRVVVEDFLDGPEISVIAICDGDVASVLPIARDYKRIGTGDTGPNTGGMGCFSPVDLPDGLVDEVTQTVLNPVLKHQADRGIAYRGFLYAGLVLTKEGPRVLEFNCRLGDPETPVVLPRLDEDLLGLLASATEGSLPNRPLRVSGRAAVDVVLAAPGYPDSVEVGSPIAGLDGVRGRDDILVFHAGTTNKDGTLRTSGGRVLNVIGLGDDLTQARERAYAAAEDIHFDGKQTRSDIAL